MPRNQLLITFAGYVPQRIGKFRLQCPVDLYRPISGKLQRDGAHGERLPIDYKLNHTEVDKGSPYKAWSFRLTRSPCAKGFSHGRHRRNRRGTRKAVLSNSPRDTFDIRYFVG